MPPDEAVGAACEPLSEGGRELEPAERRKALSDGYRECLSRLSRWEPFIDAWVQVAEGPAERVHPTTDRPLAGVPFGIKDVIDVAGLPTRFGSHAFESATPAAEDAPVVAALRSAGAIPIGKTRTTEFAFVDPTATRNPYDPRRSPGGSSSGSGAAVGARVVPFALGTQTAGSLCRPAAYCGAVSYKPGLDRFPLAGIAPLSRSFDAVGVIAQSVDWLSVVHGVLAAAFGIPAAVPGHSAPAGRLRIGLVGTPGQDPDTDMRRAMALTVRRLGRDGHLVEPVAAPVDFEALIAWHRTVMLQEAAVSLLPLVDGRLHLVGPKLAAGLREGAGIAEAERAEGLARIADARATFWDAVAEYDLLLAYAVPGAAPVGLSTTGDQAYLTPWTALGGPLVSLSAGLNPDGLPLGILLAAGPGRDAELIAEAVRLGALLPGTPPPRMPALPAA